MKLEFFTAIPNRTVATLASMYRATKASQQAAKIKEVNVTGVFGL
jgi:hypothetical protein